MIRRRLKCSMASWSIWPSWPCRVCEAMTDQKDETLRRIREMWKEAHGFLPDADGAEEYCGVNELADLQSRSYDAGYQQAIADARAEVQAVRHTLRASEEYSGAA